MLRNLYYFGIYCAKEYFYEEPLKFLGVTLMILGLIGLVSILGVVLINTIGLLLTGAIFSFVTLVIGGCIVESY